MVNFRSLLIFHSLLVIKPVLSAVILDLMERGGNGMEEAEGTISSAIEDPKEVHDTTYVLIMTKIKVPYGTLQVSS